MRLTDQGAREDERGSRLTQRERHSTDSFAFEYSTAVVYTLAISVTV